MSRPVASQSALDAYYADQASSPYYSGALYQRGHGIGGIFGSLFRSLVPLMRNTVGPALKHGAKAVAREAVRAGAGVASDVLSGQTLEDSIRRRGKQSTGRLVNRGKRKLASALAQHPPKRARKSIKGRYNDIFDN